MTNVLKTMTSASVRRARVPYNKLDKSEFMTLAHALAKTYKGHYRACMALAMRDLYQDYRLSEMVAGYAFKTDYKTGEVYDEVLVEYHNGVLKHKPIWAPSYILLHNQMHKQAPKTANYARACSNGIKYLRLKADRLAIDIDNHRKAKGPFAVLGEVYAQAKERELDEILCDIRAGEEYQDRQINPVNKREEIKSIAGIFLASILKTPYVELHKQLDIPIPKVA